MKFYFKFFQILFAFFLVLFLANCSSVPPQTIPTLSLLDVYEIPYETQFLETKVGGLSGIDYNREKNTYYIVSDDRSEHNNARIYEAKISILNDKIAKVSFQNIIYLRDSTHAFFSNNKLDAAKSTDPEDVRWNRKTKTLVWSNEGERIVDENQVFLQNSSIAEINLDGNFIEQYTLPPILKMSATENGVRKNAGIEGLAFNKDFSKLYANVEEPLYEDGIRATVDSSGIIRILELDTKTKKTINQFFYPLDAIANAPIPAEGFSVNGVSAILMYAKNRLFVVERSYSVGTDASNIKIFSFDLKTAQTTLDKKSIDITKNLVLNLDTLGIFTDNIEGITFGPKLRGGEQSLLLITDNNFSNKQKTQVLLFKILK